MSCDPAALEIRAGATFTTLGPAANPMLLVEDASGLDPPGAGVDAGFVKLTEVDPAPIGDTPPGSLTGRGFVKLTDVVPDPVGDTPPGSTTARGFVKLTDVALALIG